MTRRRWLVGAGVVLVLGLAAMVAVVADDNGNAGGRRQRWAGFDEVVIRVTAADGEMSEWCALLAATRADRQRGLMGQDDLGGYDAMVFWFEEPTTSAFYMYDTKLALSIAWFGADGDFVAADDMTPCVADDPDECPRYAPPHPYTFALEVPHGDLPELGAAPGSVLSFPGGRCPPPRRS